MYLLAKFFHRAPFRENQLRHLAQGETFLRAFQDLRAELAQQLDGESPSSILLSL